MNQHSPEDGNSLHQLDRQMDNKQKGTMSRRMLLTTVASSRRKVGGNRSISKVNFIMLIGKGRENGRA